MAAEAPKAFSSTQETRPAPRFFLLTIGPGDEYWSVWGHTALLVRMPGEGDLVYSFGHFDFNEERFFINFIKGHMRYFLDRSVASRELERMVAENRDIWMQPLLISDERAYTLLEQLQAMDTDANRYYDYDYFRANCTSKVRDLINASLDDPFEPQLRQQAGASWGELTLPVANHGWLNVALYLAYGREAWRPRDAWQTAVFPLQLKDALADLKAGGTSVVHQTRQLYASAGRPFDFWLTHGPVIGVSVLFLVGLLWSRTRYIFLRLWLGLETIVGWLLLALWLFTDHWIAAYNPNILLMFPFAWCLLGRSCRMRRALLRTYVVATVLWLAWALLTGVLYLLPWAGLNLMAAWLLWAKK